MAYGKNIGGGIMGGLHLLLAGIAQGQANRRQARADRADEEFRRGQLARMLRLDEREADRDRFERERLARLDTERAEDRRLAPRVAQAEVIERGAFSRENPGALLELAAQLRNPQARPGPVTSAGVDNPANFLFRTAAGEPVKVPPQYNVAGSFGLAGEDLDLQKAELQGRMREVLEQLRIGGRLNLADVNNTSREKIADARNQTTLKGIELRGGLQQALENLRQTGPLGQARQNLLGAQTRLATEKADDVDAAADDRRARAQAYVANVKSTGDYRRGMLEARNRAIDVQERLGNALNTIRTRGMDLNERALVLKEATEEFDQSLALMKASLDAAQDREGGKWSDSDKQEATLIRGRIAETNRQVERLAKEGDFKGAREWTAAQLVPLIDRMETLIQKNRSGPAPPAAVTLPKPTVGAGAAPRPAAASGTAPQFGRVGQKSFTPDEQQVIAALQKETNPRTGRPHTYEEAANRIYRQRARQAQ